MDCHNSTECRKNVNKTQKICTHARNVDSIEAVLVLANGSDFAFPQGEKRECFTYQS